MTIHAMPDSEFNVVDFRDDRELLASWGVIYRREFKWSPEPGFVCSVRTGKFPTADEASEAAREMAVSSGYRVPRWWEFWRWTEDRLP